MPEGAGDERSANAQGALPVTSGLKSNQMQHSVPQSH